MDSFMTLTIGLLTESIIYLQKFGLWSQYISLSLNIIFPYIKIVSTDFLLSYMHISFSMISVIISILGRLKGGGPYRNPVIVFQKCASEAAPVLPKLYNK